MSIGISANATAVVLAPVGRDASVAAGLLRGAGIDATICSQLSEFTESLDDDACFAIVTEEALRQSDLTGLVARIAAQAPWSDLPFVVLMHRGGGSSRDYGASTFSEQLGNVTFLERPFHPSTFVSVAKTALKARQRQFEARARMEQLHEGKERLRTALLAGRLGSWELDLGTGLLTTSVTCREVFGRPADAPFSYDDLINAIHPGDRDRMRFAVAATIATGDDYLIEYRNIWPDGGIHWVEIRARIVSDRTGGNRRLVGVSSDITARKMAEQNLRALNESLEERVVTRTQELRQAHKTVLAEMTQRERAEEQLRQAQKMEMIGQLTGGVAHDFNNLLMAVIGNLTLLQKHLPLAARTTRFIDGALQGANRGAALTQRLLAFARRQDLTVEPKSLVQLVDGMRDLIDRSVGAQIEVRIDLPKSVPPALVDANQVELALLNLVVNARDAMPEGGTLSIRVDEVRAPAGGDLPAGSYVRLSVTDTGHGMDADTLRKATEPFFSTKELGKGTGLGLSMIQGVALQLNGALRLTSDVGKGTRAELWLPVTTLATKSPDPVAIKLDDVPMPKMTILVVDDDALIAMSTVDMLEDLGHDVLEAGSGEKALEILKNGRPIDLLITDFSMPKMNGAQLAKEARLVRPGLPVLLATGYAEMPPGTDIDLPRIAKPYQQSQLAAEIKKVIDLATA